MVITCFEDRLTVTLKTAWTSHVGHIRTTFNGKQDAEVECGVPKPKVTLYDMSHCFRLIQILVAGTNNSS